jgi:hypothetical protein
MDLKEKIANYVLENFSRRHLPEIAMTGLEEGLESESLYILAGMNDRDNTFEVEKYFDDCLKELKFVLPTKLQAAKIMLAYYLKQIVDNPELAFKIMSKIDNEVYKQIDWKNKSPDQKASYVGEELGLEKMYTWYRELQDFDGGLLFYYNELPRDDQKKKMEWHLIEEANKLKKKMEIYK